jgi:hypothetical protein
MIDLLPISAKNTIRKEYRLRVFVVCFAAVSLIFAVALVSFLPTYFSVLSRHEAFLFESQSAELKNRMSQVKEMETIVEETNKKINLLQSSSVPRVKDIFLKILESKDSGLIITALSYNSMAVSKKGKEDSVSPASVSIQGVSSDRATLLAFKDALSRKKEIETVTLPISSLVKDTDLSFSINLVLARTNQGTTK